MARKRPQKGPKNGQSLGRMSRASSENDGSSERTDAPAFANAIVPPQRDRNEHRGREIVVTVPLPEDRGLRGGGARVRRFRSHLVELGTRLRAFRRRHGLTQA